MGALPLIWLAFAFLGGVQEKASSHPTFSFKPPYAHHPYSLGWGYGGDSNTSSCWDPHPLLQAPLLSWPEGQPLVGAAPGDSQQAPASAARPGLPKVTGGSSAAPLLLRGLPSAIPPSLEIRWPCLPHASRQWPGEVSHTSVNK